MHLLSALSRVARPACALLAAALASPLMAANGYISTPSLNPIYGQAAFGSAPITINWLAPVAPLIAPALTSIDSLNELMDLGFAASESAPVVNVFFVDQISFCESAGSYSGCTLDFSNVFAVRSSVAAGPSGAALLAHELGHVLGLPHVGGNNLMNPSVGPTLLTIAQANTILGAANYVQVAGNGNRFIELRPIAVLSAVPEPHAVALLAAGLLVVGTAVRRRK